MTNQKVDVVVVGGGPAGSTSATMLARKGWRVVLLERERFPRDHVGESLLPASIPVMEELGVLTAVREAGFLHKAGATMVWGSDREPWSWYFRETNQRYPHSYQVWRPQFDQILLENSRSNGVEVLEGHRVTEVLFQGGRASGVRYLAGDAAGTIEALFVVDASGQAGLLGRSLRLRRWDPFFRNLAVYGYFTRAERLPAPDETNIFIESYTGGWLWSIPLHTGWTSVGAVVDSRGGQEQIGRQGVGDFLRGQIAQGPHTAGMLRNAALVAGPFTVKDWSYVSERPAGNGYVLVGDAACFVDPLFSSGVHLAFTSGVLGAAYATSALNDPGMAEAAGGVYAELYHQEYSRFREMARLFYSSNRTVDSYFWESRRILDSGDDVTPRQAFINAVAGQPPRGYERAVLDRGVAPREFMAEVKEVESARAKRLALLEGLRAAPDGRARLRLAAPRLAEGVRVLRKPVAAEGEFVWSDVISTPGHPEGTPCSALVAKMVSLIDGRNSVEDILTKLRREVDENRVLQMEQSALTALGILYVEGAVAELGVTW